MELNEIRAIALEVRILIAALHSAFVKELCELLCTSRRSKPVAAIIRNAPGRCTAAQRGRYVPLSARSGKLISADPRRQDWQFEVFGILQLSCWSLTAPSHLQAKFRKYMPR